MVSHALLPLLNGQEDFLALYSINSLVQLVGLNKAGIVNPKLVIRDRRLIITKFATS